MSGKKLRFGIAGPGTIGHFHSTALQQIAGAELIAIYGRNEAKTKAFAEQYGIKAYTNLSEFLGADGLDAITIATPSGAHLEIAASAAEQGKHILCEKPLEVTPERSAAIISACSENKVQLGVFFQARFDECIRLAKQAIEEGRLGKILLASCQMRWYRSQDYYDSAAWRGTWVLDGGGCLMNQGIHTIDLLIHLVGTPSLVSAFQGPLSHERIEVEDNICATVRFQNGAIGTIEASTSCTPGFPRRVEISGETGTICIEDNRIIRWEFTDNRPGDEEIIKQFSGSKDGKGGAADPTAIDVAGHRQIVEDFIGSVQEKKQPFISGFEGKKAVEFVCAIYKSVQNGGAPVQLMGGEAK